MSGASGEFTSVEKDPDDDASFIAPDLLLSFWRPFAADDEPGEEQGCYFYFGSVLLARPGYYDTPAQTAERLQQSSSRFPSGCRQESFPPEAAADAAVHLTLDHLIRLTWPSTVSELHGSAALAVTAARYRSRPLTRVWTLGRTSVRTPEPRTPEPRAPHHRNSPS